MGYYRPRPTEIITCKNCGISFETRHKRTMYCGESCRQLAYQARHRIEQEDPRTAKGNLSFSMQNVGVTATGAAAAAIGNYLLNDRPFYIELNDRLRALERILGKQQGKVDVNQAYLRIFIKAVRQEMPGVDMTMRLIESQQQKLMP